MRNLSKTEKVKESIQRWIAIILLAITLLNNFSALAFTLSEYETLTAESSISDGQNNENNGEEEPVATASPETEEPEEPITTSRPNRVTSNNAGNNSTTNNDTNTSVDEPGAEDPIVTPPPVEEPTEEEKSIAMIASGYDFTIALDGKGNVWAWGENGHGQLGNGTLTARGIKTEVTLSNGTQLSNVKQISAGDYHAAALTNDGKVYIWGYNYFGQTSSDSYKNILNPMLVEGISGIAKEISCGARFTTILTEDNKVYGVGDSNNGQLGYYNPLRFTSVREIEELKPTKELPTNIKSISAGNTYLVMLDEAGAVYTVGGQTGTAFDFSTITKIETPAMEKVISGYNCYIGLGKDGLVYTWNYGGTPTQVSLDGEATDIGINYTTYHAIVNDELYSWGPTSLGSAGVGNNTSNITTPTKISTVGSPVADTINTKIDKVSSSLGTTVYAINEEGYVLGWGWAGSNNNASDEGENRTNNYKLLGAKTRNYADYIGFITLKEEFNNITMNVGDKFAFNKMLTEQGIISGEEKVNLYKEFETNYDTIVTRSVNDNIAKLENGILTGISQGQTYVEIKNPTTGYSVLVRVTVNGDGAYTKLESGDSFTVALKSDGTVWMWGYNDALGIKDVVHTGSGVGIILPTQIKGLENIKDISVGRNHILALRKDGTVVAWGLNTYGQLGNNDVTKATVDISTPAVVMVGNYQYSKQKAPELSLKVVEPVEGEIVTQPTQDIYTDGTSDYYKEGDYYRRVADNSYAYKVDTDGVTYVVNTAGEFIKVLGIGNNVTPLTNIVKIAAGDNFSIAVDKDGNVYTWGSNDCQQLANGISYAEANSQVAAVKIQLDENIVKEGIEQIEASAATGYILTKAGNIYAWGNNNRYQCGRGGANIAVPTKMDTQKRVSKIAVSMDGTGLAIGVDGKVYAWGYNLNRIFGNLSSAYLTFTRLDMIDVNVADIAISATGAIAITTDNKVIAWGRNYPTNTYQVISQNASEQISDIALISEGNDFHAMAKTDGTVWTSGLNNYGQLGNRTTTGTAYNMAEEISKAYVTLNTNKVDLKVGETASITGKYSYGFNLYNREESVNLLNGTSFDTTIATISNNVITAVGSGKTYVVVEDEKTNTQQIVEVNVLDTDDITAPDVSNGYDHTVTLKTNGDVYIWGNNTYGQLGMPLDTKCVSKPELMNVNKKAIDVEAGQYYTLILTSDNKVLATGYNGEGQLGNNSTKSSDGLVSVLIGTVDKDGNVTCEELTNIVKIATGTNVSMALDKDGNVYAWGYGYNSYATKLDIYGLKVKDIADRAVITEDGRVWILNGMNNYKFVLGLDNVATISTSINDLYVAATTSGEVYTWKKAGARENYVTASVVPVKNETLTNIVEVASAGTSAFAIDKDKKVYAWGYNGYSELGLGALGISGGQVTTPTAIPDFEAEMISVSQRADNRVRAITEMPDGSVYAWGYNADGMLGKGDTQGYSEPALIGDSYVGFVVDGKVVNRISMPINSSKTINATIVTGLNLRKGLAKVDTNKEFTWQMMNEDAISVNSNKSEATVTAKTNMGEAVVIATDPETGKTGKLYIDIVKNNTNKVTPKVESLGNHSISLKADGTVWAWGYFGELGLTNSEVLEPIKVDIDDTIVDIATSTNHTLLLTETGTVYSFGNNGNYQLGRFDGAPVGNVTQSTGEVLKDIVKVVAGQNYSLALDKEGNIWVWGYYGIINASYPTKLTGTINGVKVSEALTNIVDITKHYALDSEGNVIDLGIVMRNRNVILGTKVAGITGKVKKISTGINHSLFLTETGTVYAAGADNSYGQLGNDTTAITVVDNGIPTATVVLDNNSQPLANIVDISAGSEHSLAVDKAGNVYAWGSNRNYQLANRIATNNNAVRARKIEAISDVAFVSAGNVQSVVVKNDGTVYAWGTGTSGQLGNKLTGVSVDPVRVGSVAITTTTNHITLIEGKNSSSSFAAENKILNLLYPQTVDVTGIVSSDTNIVTVEKTETELKVTAVNAGTASIKVTAVSESGETYINIVQVTVLPKDIELENTYFVTEQITDETTGATTDITKLNDKFGKQIITPMVSTTQDHTLVLKSDGTVWAYGKNQYGQLGNGTTSYSDRPVQVMFPASAGPIVSVAAGEQFSVAVDLNGRVYTWGINTNGQLGLGVADNGAYTTPSLVPGIYGITKVEAGENHVIALSKNGYAYVWGKNTSGSLGIAGSTTVPQQISTIADVIDVEAGEDHSLILTANGTVYATGRNAFGQLGVSVDKTNRNSFEIVPINATIQYIAAGKAMSMAVDTEGKVWVWGKNTSGQLGLNIESEYISTPTKISTIGGNTNYKAATVSAGTNTTEVLMSSGELYVAGANNLGQLGNNRATEISRVFIKVNTLGNDVLNADVGNDYSAVITKNGSVWGFGDYNQGALSYKSRTNSDIPVRIYDDVSSVEQSEITVRVGETKKLDVNGKNKFNALHKDTATFTYSDINSDIATIDANGIITGVKVGTTWVKATDDEGKVSIAQIKVVEPDAIVAAKVDGGERFTAVIDETGTLWTFGTLAEENTSLGDSAGTKISGVPIKTTDIQYKNVAVGDKFAVAVDSTGSIWAWGENSKGQLGSGDYDNRLSVNRINAVYYNGFTQIAAGDNHVIALDDLGILYAWGDNTYGQLGLSKSIKNVNNPTVISPISGKIVSISAGGNNTAIVDATGNVYLFGRSTNGILRKVPNIDNAVKVVTSDNYTLVLTTEGKVKMIENPSLKVTQKGNSFAVDIVLENTTYDYIDKDGILWSGATNTTQPRNNDIENVFGIGIGNNNEYYISTSGEVYAKGDNQYGQLGNGTLNDDNAPTKLSSSEYVKVGNRGYNLVPSKIKVAPDWKILVGNKELKALMTDKTKFAEMSMSNEFNVFKNSELNLDEYIFNIDNTNIAEITDDTLIEITAKAKGQTVLQITDKFTGKTSELTIFCVEEDNLRINDITLETEDKNYLAEVENATDYIINADDTNGDLLIDLAVADTLMIKKGDTYLNGVTRVNGTNMWTLPGVGTDTIEEYTLELYPNGFGEEPCYTYNLKIVKGISVEVNNEILIHKDKVFTKYVNPNDDTAKVSISTTANAIIRFEDAEGMAIKQSELGDKTLVIDAVEIPSVTNKFTITIIEDEQIKDQYSLIINKSSVESLKLTEEYPLAQIREIKGIDRLDTYVREYNVKTDERNNPVKLSLDIQNKNVTKVTVDGKVVEIVDGKLDIEKLIEAKEGQITQVEVDVYVQDVITLETYVEKHLIKIQQVSANTEIKNVQLLELNGEELETPLVSKKSKREKTHDIVLHDENAQVDNIRIKVNLESINAKFGFDINSCNYSSGAVLTIPSAQLEKDGPNRTVRRIYVQAENGDIVGYDLIIYGQSENAYIEEVKSITQNPTDERVAVQINGTNNYDVVVMKNKDNYEVQITLEETYANIILKDEAGNIIEDSFGKLVDKDGNEYSAVSIIENEDGTKTYVYEFTKDILGKEISVKVQPEYKKLDATEYKMTIREMDSSSVIEYITVNGIPVEDIAKIKADDIANLVVKTESEHATIEIYLKDPDDPEAEKLFTATGNLDEDVKDLLNEGDNKFYVKVTSEDGTSTTKKEINIYKQSDNASLKDIQVDLGNIVKGIDEEGNITYELQISDDATSVGVTVIPENANATIGLPGGQANGSTVSIEGLDSIKVTITSEDGTVTKEYTINIVRLSSDDSIKDIKVINNDKQEKPYDEYVQTDDENRYEFEVNEKWSKTKLYVEMNDAETEISWAIVSKDGTTVTNPTYSEYAKGPIEISLPDNTTTTKVTTSIVDLRIKPANGEVTNYKAVITPKHNLGFDKITLNVFDASNTQKADWLDSQETINKDLENGAIASTVYVHPNANSVTIQAQPNYADVNVTISYNKVEKNTETGEEVITPVEVTLSSPTSAYKIEKLNDEVTDVKIKMEAKDGSGSAIYNITIARGENTASLESLELQATENTKLEYSTTEIKENVIKSKDDLYKVVGTTKDNATIQIFNVTGIDNVENATLTADKEITANPMLDLSDGTIKRIAVKVTSRFKDETQIVVVDVRKASSDTEITALDVVSSGEKLPVVISKTPNKDGYYEISVISPGTLDLSLNDITLSNEDATIKSTIIGISTKPTGYSEVKLPMEKAITGTLGRTGAQRYQFIEVTAENGIDKKVYAVTYRKASTAHDMGDIEVYDQVNKKVDINDNIALVSIFDNKATIKGISSSEHGATKLVIQSINGCALKEAIKATDTYVAMFDKDTVYECIDDEGNVINIAGNNVTEMSVKATYISESAVLFNTVDTPENSTTVTIKRVNKSTDFILTIYDADKLGDDGKPTVVMTLDTETLTGLDLNADGDFLKTLSIPSSLTNVIIEAKPKNNATVESFIGVAEDGSIVFTATDKEKKQLIITTVAEDGETKNTYIITLQEQSYNTGVTEIKVNEKTATKIDEKYEQPILSSEIVVDKNLVVNAATSDTNALATMKITSVNGTAVTTSSVENGKSLYAELEKVISDLSTVTEITVEVTVKAEDRNVTKTYTVDIPVIGLGISSIHLTDDLGNGYDLTEGTDPKIIPTSTNRFKNDKDILVPNDAKTLTINEEDIVLENENITIVTPMPLTITLDNNGKASAVITTSINGVEQVYTITVRRKSAETNIESILVDDENATKVSDSWMHDISYDAKPEIIVTTKDKNATITKVEIYYIDESGNEVKLEECTATKVTAGKFKFNITKTDGLYNHNTENTGDRTQRELKARITVKPENEIPEDSYVLNLTRKDTNSELKSLTYTDTVAVTVNASEFNDKKVKEVKLSTTELTNTTSITLNSLVAKCSEVEDIKAFDEQGNEIKSEDAITINDGETRTIRIIVRAEYKPNENFTTYTLKLYRKSANSDFDTVYISDKEIPTDDSYKSFSAESIYDETNEVYNLSVDVDKDPTIKLGIPEKAKITAVSVYEQTPDDLAGIAQADIDSTVNNKFTINGLADLYVDDDTEHTNSNNRVIVAKVTVKPEEGLDKTYTFNITRTHIDATLPISYSYVDENGTQTGTETFTETTKRSKELFIPGATTEVVIGAIETRCEYASIVSVEKITNASGVKTKETIDATIPNTLTFANEGDSVELVITVAKENGSKVVYKYLIIRSSTDISLSYVKVDNVSAEEQAETEEGFDKIYRVSISSKSPSDVEILSKNPFATVEVVNTTNYTTTPNDKIYKEEGKVTYAVIDTEKVIEVKVTSQDGTQIAKYKVYVEIIGSSASISTIDIKDVNGNTLYTALKNKVHVSGNRYEDGQMKTTYSRYGRYPIYYKDNTYIYTLPADIGEFTFDNLIPDSTKPVDGQTYTILENTNSIPENSSYGDYVTSYKFNRNESKTYNLGDTISIGQGILKTYTIRVTSKDKKTITEYDVTIVRKTDNTNIDTITFGNYSAVKNNTTGEWEIKIPRTEDTGRLTITTKQQVSGITIQDTILDNKYVNKNNWYNSRNDGLITNATYRNTYKEYGRTTTIKSNTAYDISNMEKLDMEDNKEETIGVRVSPQDTTNKAATEETIRIIRQFINKDLENITVTDNDTTEAINLAHDDFENYYKMIIVPATTTSVTLSDIRAVVKENATIASITVDGVGVENVNEAIDIDLANEGDEVTVKVTTKAEAGYTATYTLVIRRMMTTTDLAETDGIIVSNKDTGVINTLNLVDTDKFETYISAKQENTRIQVNTLNNKYTTVNVSVKQVIDSKDIDVTDELTGILTRVTDKNDWTLSTKDARKYILDVEVIPEDAVNGETRNYELIIIRRDDNADIEFIKANEDLATIDKIAAHYPGYETLNELAIDDSIYTVYISDKATTADIEIQTESNYASIVFSDKDGVELATGINNVKYTLDVPEVIVETKVKAISEDGSETKEYTLYIIKKSDDTTIKSLRVFTNEEKTETAELPVVYRNGEYYVEVSDAIPSVWVEAIPNYEAALVSINTQSSEWGQSTRRIDLMETSSEVAQERELYKDVTVFIPAIQSLCGEDCTNSKVIHIKRVSLDNGIESVKTSNNNDKSGGDNYVKEIIDGKEVEIGTWTVELGEPSRTSLDTLEIRALSEKAQVELYDNYEGTLIESAQEGTLVTYGFDIAEEEITTVWAKVTPEQGEAKWHRIELVPKGCNADLDYIIIGETTKVFTPGQYSPLFADLGITDLVDITAVAVNNSRIEGEGTGINFSDLNPDEWGTGEATVTNVDLVNKNEFIITTISPNKKYTRTYTIRLTELDDENGIENITFTDNDVTKEAVQDEAGRFIVEVGSLTTSTDIKINLVDKQYATVEVIDPETDTSLKYGVTGITVTESDLLNLSEDRIRQIKVTAQNGDVASYDLVIRKVTAIEGTVLTENVSGNYSNAKVEIISGDSEEPKYTFDTVNADGTFYVKLDEEDLSSSFKIVITKEGFLPHIINVPAVEYGKTYYMGDIQLMGGNVYQKNGEVDDKIDYRDLGQLNRVVNGARASTTINLDLNEDGKVDELDLAILTKNYDKQAITKDYVRNIKIEGQLKGEDLSLGTLELIDINNKVVQKANISETGEFTLRNIEMTADGTKTQYTLQARDAEGNIKATKTVFVNQGNTYEIVDTLDDTNITVTHSLSILQLDVTVGTQRLAISKRDVEPTIDIIAPEIDITEMKYTINGLSIKGTTTDNSDLANIKITIDDVEKYFGVLDGATANIARNIALQTSFGVEHKVVIEVTDKSSNKQVYEVTLANNTIKDAKDLTVLSSNVSSGISYEGETVELLTDIDMTDITWKPIGNSTKEFMGTFEGNGHVITGLTINTTSSNQGLFGSVNGATIRNVGLEASELSVGTSSGAIAGTAKNSTIENCYTTITINGTESAMNIGGIVGKAENTLIKNCYNTGAITGYTYVGGIVGQASKDTVIENCYNIGNVTATYTKGEVVGNADETTTISNCYGTDATADILQGSQQELVWVADITNINNGYPILKWQEERAEKMAKNAVAMVMSTQSEDTGMILPVTTKYTVTSEFGPRTAPTEGASTYHSGMDIAAEWQSEILAVADGVVTFAGEQSGYGYCIEIKHEINGNTVYSFYAHLYERKVEEGDIVSKGQVIALEGGRPGDAGSGTSTGPHLHFEIRNASKEKLNPRDYIKF